MDTKSYSASEWLNAQVVKDSRNKVFLITKDCVRHEVRNTLVFQGELDAQPIKWEINKTSLRNIQEVFGYESSNYVGKRIKLQVMTGAKNIQMIYGVPIPEPVKNGFSGVERVDNYDILDSDVV